MHALKHQRLEAVIGLPYRIINLLTPLKDTELKEIGSRQKSYNLVLQTLLHMLNFKNVSGSVGVNATPQGLRD